MSLTNIEWARPKEKIRPLLSLLPAKYAQLSLPLRYFKGGSSECFPPLGILLFVPPPCREIEIVCNVPSLTTPHPSSSGSSIRAPAFPNPGFLLIVLGSSARAGGGVTFRGLPLGGTRKGGARRMYVGLPLSFFVCGRRVVLEGARRQEEGKCFLYPSMMGQKGTRLERRTIFCRI